jgi:hypothetical protein
MWVPPSRACPSTTGRTTCGLAVTLLACHSDSRSLVSYSRSTTCIRPVGRGKYHTHLRPAPQYMLIYDLPERELFDLAYLFKAPDQGVGDEIGDALTAMAREWDDCHPRCRFRRDEERCLTPSRSGCGGSTTWRHETCPGMDLGNSLLDVGTTSARDVAQRLFQQGARRVEFARPVDLTDVEAVRSLALIRHLTSLAIVVDWQLVLDAEEQWRLLCHLWTPSVVVTRHGGTGMAERWPGRRPRGPQWTVWFAPGWSCGSVITCCGCPPLRSVGSGRRCSCDLTGATTLLDAFAQEAPGGRGCLPGASWCDQPASVGLRRRDVGARYLVRVVDLVLTRVGLRPPVRLVPREVVHLRWVGVVGRGVRAGQALVCPPFLPLGRHRLLVRWHRGRLTEGSAWLLSLRV